MATRCNNYRQPTILSAPVLRSNHSSILTESPLVSSGILQTITQLAPQLLVPPRLWNGGERKIKRPQNKHGIRKAHKHGGIHICVHHTVLPHTHMRPPHRAPSHTYASTTPCSLTHICVHHTVLPHTHMRPPHRAPSHTYASTTPCSLTHICVHHTVLPHTHMHACTHTHPSDFQTIKPVLTQDNIPEVANQAWLLDTEELRSPAGSKVGHNTQEHTRTHARTHPTQHPVVLTVSNKKSILSLSFLI